MQLNNLIDEGENIEKNSEKEFYSKEVLKQKGSRWINKSISYLRKNYSESVLVGDFILESEKSDKNYHNMVSILKGLKDVEEELGLLNEGKEEDSIEY